METQIQPTIIQRRIAIIADALAQLQAKLYRTGSFGYVKLPTHLQERSVETPYVSAQDCLGAELGTETCGVCAKGALLLSTVRLENRFELGQLSAGHDELLTRLTEEGLFSRENLFLVECYYEGWWKTFKWSSGWAVGVYYYDDCRAGLGSGLTQAEFDEQHASKIRELSARYPAGIGSDRTERLLVILHNMLEHDGIFMPQELPLDR